MEEFEKKYPKQKEFVQKKRSEVETKQQNQQQITAFLRQVAKASYLGMCENAKLCVTAVNMLEQYGNAEDVELQWRRQASQILVETR